MSSFAPQTQPVLCTVAHSKPIVLQMSASKAGRNCAALLLLVLIFISNPINISKDIVSLSDQLAKLSKPEAA